MITVKEKTEVFRRSLQEPARKGAIYRGINRRATSLLPPPMSAADILLRNASINSCNNLLLSLEANKQSGCLITQSEKYKSRSGILIHKGRILGCVYGQKNMRGYSFGNLAFSQILRDLQNPNKVVDVCRLKDELVVAAGALFHGQAVERPEMPADQFFSEALIQLLKSDVPGCLVVTDRKDATTYIVYVFGGQLVGIHCSWKGWLKPDATMLQQYISQNKGVRVQSCSMPITGMAEISRYSFSLSGFADSDFSNAADLNHGHRLNVFHKLSLDDPGAYRSPFNSFLKAFFG